MKERESGPMARKTKTRSPKPQIQPPYSEFSETRLWLVLSGAIDELVANRDLEEKTARRYIIGYIARCLSENDLLSSAAREMVKNST